MAKSLRILIEMAGAEEIKSQLEGVGEAGEEAFKKILDAANKAGGFNKLDPSVATKALEEFGVKGSAAVNKVTGAVQTAARLEPLINGLRAVETGLAGVQRAASAADAMLGTALMKSVTTVARLLPAAFAGGTVAAIGVTIQALSALDARAIQLGKSIADLGKAEAIFKTMGASSKEAASGVASFSEAMDLKNVKQAIQNLDEFGRSADSSANWLRILEEISKGSGEAARLASEHLTKLGKVQLSGPTKDIDKISQSSASLSDKILAMLQVFEKMGDTSGRNALIFKTFNKELATLIVQMLDAGISAKDMAREIEGTQQPTKAAAREVALLNMEWERWKKLLGSSFDISPEALNMITRILAAVREAMVAFTQLKSVVGTISIGDNTLRELIAIGSALTSIGNIATSAWNALVNGASAAASSIVQFFSQLPGQIAGYFAGIGSGLWQGFVSGAQSAAQMVLQFFQQMPGQITGYFAGLGSGLWDSIVQSAQAAWDKIVGFIERAIEAARRFAGMGGGQAAGAGAQGRAHGGLIGGRGTGTSDSNLAWLSRGEHIMPARAVRQPGVLQLLEALRRSGGNLRGVLDRMGHFAMGGMVSAPAFATGGVASGMSNVTIQFPGVQPVTGLRASSVVVDELRRSAALAQVRSGGRKPSRYT